MQFDNDGEWRGGDHPLRHGEAELLPAHHPRRSDHFRIRFSGTGGWRLYSLVRGELIPAASSRAGRGGNKKGEPYGKSRYTGDQFRKSAQDSGLWGQFSQADLSMAQQNPDFGMSILKTKQDYRNATTDEARAAAHRQADALRSSWWIHRGREWRQLCP